MRHVIALAPLAFATLISACYPDYGEIPGAGTTSLATIQEGFSENFFTGPAPTGEPDYLAWAAFYDPAPGQICMLYGVVRGSLDGSETYTAQVFSGTTALGESYFYGAMFK